MLFRSVVVDGKSPWVVVTDNLIVMAHFFGTYRNNDQELEEWDKVMAAIRVEGLDHVVTGNAVAGSERAAFRGPGMACLGKSA